MKDLKKRMLMPFKIIIGSTYNHLTILAHLGGRYYLCKCVCGKEKKVRTDHFRNGKTTSCGCVGEKNRMNGTVKHSHSYNRLYFVWYSMMDRCYNEKFQDFYNYGGRGIKVCDRWHDVSNFITDMAEGAAKGLQLDRKDNDGDYNKDNCKWSTRKENNRNKRTNRKITIDGITLTAIEWSEQSGIVYTTILGRYNRGVRGKDIIKHVV